MEVEGAVILGADAERALHKAMEGIGALCGVCGLSTYPENVDPEHEVPSCWQYALAHPQIDEGTARVIVQMIFVCNRKRCIEKAEAAPGVIARRVRVAWEPRVKNPDAEHAEPQPEGMNPGVEETP